MYQIREPIRFGSFGCQYYSWPLSVCSHFRTGWKGIGGRRNLKKRNILKVKWLKKKKKKIIIKKNKNKKKLATLTIFYSSYRILPGYNFVDWSFMKTFDNLLSSTVLRRIVKYSRSKNFFSGTRIHTMNCILRIIFFSIFFLH